VSEQRIFLAGELIRNMLFFRYPQNYFRRASDGVCLSRVPLWMPYTNLH